MARHIHHHPSLLGDPRQRPTELRTPERDLVLYDLREAEQALCNVRRTIERVPGGGETRLFVERALLQVRNARAAVPTERLTA